jgi:hypothetical protein
MHLAPSPRAQGQQGPTAAGPNGTRTQWHQDPTAPASSAEDGPFAYPCGELWSLRARPILAALIRMRATAPMMTRSRSI